MSRRPVIGLSALVSALLIPLASIAGAPAAHAADRDCSDFGSQRDAQIFFLQQGGPSSDPHRLDADGDGIVCESNGGATYYGTSLPGGGSSPAPAPAPPKPKIKNVRSTVDLTVAPRALVAGERFRVTVKVRPAISRKVVLQRKVDGRWRSFGSGTTSKRGVTHGDFRAPKASTTYRAVVATLVRGTSRYSTATSRPRTVGVQQQRVTLAFAEPAAAAGAAAQAVVRVSPVRPGRTVALQRWNGSGWVGVRNAKVDSRGQAVIPTTAPLGRTGFRAVALAHAGAAAVSSSAVALTGSDATPPPAPYGLTATPGNGSVVLSWSRTAVADFAHDEVWMSAGGGPWQVVQTTGGTGAVVDRLVNGTTYSFTVTSTDTSGNRSAVAPVVATTPTFPPVD
ncbi:excalibur calcium-binding domain-containing protein [Nocardioides litoris]|uniref:excalibur calcium-binding domain-containing protein n=1 Tax=Nocardioides litoris TaxID=1926648 RepID=UPI0011246554|nr:excalibur calcium-binding domain-containing protein [Nocardioides litoris]